MFVTCSSGPILRLSTGTRSGAVHPVRSMGRFIATSRLLVLVGIVLGGVLGGLLLLVLVVVVVVEVARLPHRRSPFRYITSGQAGVRPPFPLRPRRSPPSPSRYLGRYFGSLRRATRPSARPRCGSWWPGRSPAPAPPGP